MLAATRYQLFIDIPKLGWVAFGAVGSPEYAIKICKGVEQTSGRKTRAVDRLTHRIVYETYKQAVISGGNMALVLGGLDIVGDDLDGDDMEGMSTIGRARARARMKGGKVAVATPRWMNATTSQGVSRPQEDLDFLSFTPLTIAAGASNGTLSSQPQRPFRGERLILTANNITGGADVSGTATINPAIFVGAVQVGSTQGATPFQAFRADAFGVRLSWPAAGQGTTINIPVVLTTVAAAGGVAVAGTVFGRAMR